MNDSPFLRITFLVTWTRVVESMAKSEFNGHTDSDTCVDTIRNMKHINTSEILITLYLCSNIMLVLMHVEKKMYGIIFMQLKQI